METLSRGEVESKGLLPEQLVEMQGLGLDVGVAHEVGREPRPVDDRVEQGHRDHAQVVDGIIRARLPLDGVQDRADGVIGGAVEQLVLVRDVPVDAGDPTAQALGERPEGQGRLPGLVEQRHGFGENGSIE